MAIFRIQFPFIRTFLDHLILLRFSADSSQEACQEPLNSTWELAVSRDRRWELGTTWQCKWRIPTDS